MKKEKPHLYMGIIVPTGLQICTPAAEISTTPNPDKRGCTDLSQGKPEKKWFHLSALQGHIAMWAVRQSPYHKPDDLLVVLEKFRIYTKIYFDGNDMAEMSWREVEHLMKTFLYQIPEFMAWNQRKNGNQSHYSFVSAYGSEKNPDNDFIDLDALIRNVRMSLFAELESQ